MPMLPTLSSQFFINNRQAIRTKLRGKLPLVIAAHGTLQRTADSSLPFSQDSNFWYLTGLSIPDAVLVISEEDEYLIVPKRSVIRETFDGATSNGELTERSGIAAVFDESEGWRKITNDCTTSKQVSYLQPLRAYDARHGIYANPARRRLADKLRRTVPKLSLYDARPELAALRCIKQPVEVELLKAAVRITKETFAEVTEGSAFSTMQYEYELEAALTFGLRRRGASGHAYDPIVASGQNATTLHYIHNQSRLGQNDFIVVDVGAEVEHYAADITRTLIQSQPSSRQQAVYATVADVQAKALAMLRPGVRLRDYEQAVEKQMGIALQQLHLITYPGDHDSIRRYYPHSTSHFLGLDVHDVGDYNQPLTPGMVLTCEPGIYIPEESIGVRIEDDIVITDNGMRIL